MSATHAVFAPPAMERLADCPFTKLAVTDTIPIGNRADAIKDRLVVLSVAELLGEAIHRIHHNESVSALFSNGKGERGRFESRYEIEIDIETIELRRSHGSSKSSTGESRRAASWARGRTSVCAIPGMFPGVIYGHKEAVVPVTLPTSATWSTTSSKARTCST